MGSLMLSVSLDEHTFLPPVESLPEFSAPTAWAQMAALPKQNVRDDAPEGAGSVHGGECPAPPWWTDTVGMLDPARFYRISDAFVFPKFGVVCSNVGGLLRTSAAEASYSGQNFWFLPHCTVRPDGTAFDPPPNTCRIASVAVVLPWGGIAEHPNYGHFLLDGLLTAVLMAEAGLLDHFIPIGPLLKPWQRRHFELAGIDLREIGNELIRADAVAFASTLDHNLHRPNRTYLRLRDRQFASLGITPSSDPAVKIYIARPDGASRKSSSEAELQSALAARGFLLLDPGGMTVDAQIEIFAKASVVVGAAGAGLANALYVPRSALVVEIQPKGMENAWVQKLCAITGSRFGAYFTPSRLVDPAKPVEGLTYSLDVDRFCGFLDRLMGADRPGANNR